MKKLMTLFSLFSILGINAQTTLTNYSDFTAIDVHGQSHTISAYLDSGKYVFIDFFFTTCPPCISSVPYINQIFNAYGQNNGDVIMIAVDNGDSKNEVLNYETTYGGLLPAISGDDGGTAVCSDYQIGAYPTFILIAPDGEIVEQDIWPASYNIISSTFNAYGISQAAGVEDVEEIFFNVYPNPASELLIMESNMAIKGIQVYNLLGQELKGQIEVWTAQKWGIYISELPLGSYFIQIETEKGAMKKMFQKI